LAKANLKGKSTQLTLGGRKCGIVLAGGRRKPFWAEKDETDNEKAPESQRGG